MNFFVKFSHIFLKFLNWLLKFREILWNFGRFCWLHGVFVKLFDTFSLSSACNSSKVLPPCIDATWKASIFFRRKTEGKHLLTPTDAWKWKKMIQCWTTEVCNFDFPYSVIGSAEESNKFLCISAIVQLLGVSWTPIAVKNWRSARPWWLPRSYSEV